MAKGPAGLVVECIGPATEKERALLESVVRRQHRLFSGGIAAHAALDLRALSAETGVSPEQIRSVLSQAFVVYRGEPLEASRLVGPCHASGNGPISSDRVKFFLLNEIAARPAVDDLELARELSETGVNVSFAEIARYRRELLGPNAPSRGPYPRSDLEKALRTLAPCTWLRLGAGFSSQPDQRISDRGVGERRLRTACGPGIPPPPGYRRMEGTLFDHQRAALASLRNWFESPEQRGILCLPTGAGKTRTAVSFVIDQLLQRPKAKCIWLTHRDELVDQAYGAFVEFGHRAPRPFHVGRWQQGPQKDRDRGTTVLVAMIPTLAREGAVEDLLRAHERFDLAIVDECHHGVARTWQDVLRRLESKKSILRVLGLSATPIRTVSTEDAVLRDVLGHVIFEKELLPLIEQQILARPVINPLHTKLTFAASDKERAQYRPNGELPPALITRIANDLGRNQMIADEICRNRARWGPTLVFAGTVEQGRALTKLLGERGVAVGDVYGDTAAGRRAELVESFRSGRVAVVVNCGVFTEGTDLPSVQTVVLARPTRSRVLFAQMVGRGMRGPKISGSAECLVVACSDEVQGLLQEHLASTFSKREADEILGLKGEHAPANNAPSVELVDDAVADAEDDDDTSEQARASFVEYGLVATESATLPLLGWWEATVGERRRFLPCFLDPARQAVEAWIATGRSGPLVVPGAPDEVVAKFARAARRDGARVEWRDIRIVVDADIATVRAALEQPDSPPEPDTPTISESPAMSEEVARALEHVARRIGAPDTGIAVGTDPLVPEATYSWALDWWNRFGGQVQSPSEDVVQSFLVLARSAAPREVDWQAARSVLEEAVRKRAFPAAVARPRITSEAKLQDVLYGLPKNQWRPALKLMLDDRVLDLGPEVRDESAALTRVLRLALRKEGQ